MEEGLRWGRLQLSFVDVFQGGGNGAHVQLDAPSPVLHIPDFLGGVVVVGIHKSGWVECGLGNEWGHFPPISYKGLYLDPPTTFTFF